jgi:Putative motility protein
MSIQFDPTGAAAAVQSQACVMVLSKSLKAEQEHAAQLLQSMPPAGATAPPAGPSPAGMGQRLDAFA